MHLAGPAVAPGQRQRQHLRVRRQQRHESRQGRRAAAGLREQHDAGRWPLGRAQRMTVEAVLRLSQAMAEWAQWAAQNIPAAEDPGPDQDLDTADRG